MLRVELHLQDPAGWSRVYEEQNSTLFIPDEAPPQVEEQVRVDLQVGHDGPRVILRGRVVSRRTVGSDGLPKGYSVALGPYEREKVNYLNGYIRGGFINLRETRRLPIRLRVDYGDTGSTRSSHTRDLNEEGVFVVTESPLPEGSSVSLVIYVPGFPQPLTVTGVVSHTVVVEDEDVPGMGLRFAFEAGQQDTFTAVVDNLAKRFEVGDLPDDCLM